MKIGVSGAQGSFSEEAGNYYCYKEGIKDFDTTYLISVENVLKALDDGGIDIGIFPIENSNGGIVHEAVHAMANHIFDIEKIFEIDIHHNLLVLPGTKRDSVKKIASHPQAIKQCRMYLKKNWPKVEIIEYEDTAKAAKDIKNGVLDSSTAALSAEKAAQLYEMEILESSVQDLKFNYTAFIAAKKK